MYNEGMNYNLTITKTEPNPNYKEELKKWKDDQRWGRTIPDERGWPQPEIVHDVLKVELTEEQFKKVKAEVFKVFE